MRLNQVNILMELSLGFSPSSPSFLSPLIVRLHNLNNYVRLHVCVSFRIWVCHTLGISVASQNVTNKSFLVCVKSEKYAFWATLKYLGTMQQVEAELSTLHYQAKGSQAAYNKTHFSISSPPQCRSQAVVCVSTPRMYPQSG